MTLLLRIAHALARCILSILTLLLWLLLLLIL